MIRHDDRSVEITELMHSTPQAGERSIGGQQILRRNTPDCENDPRLEQPDLPPEIG